MTGLVERANNLFRARYAKTTELERVFVYGTLVDPRAVEKALGHGVQAVPALLPGYERKTHNEGDQHHPDGFKYLEPQSASLVRGQLLRLTQADLRKLDSYEYQYHRQAVHLADGRMAWAYFMDKRDL